MIEQPYADPGWLDELLAQPVNFLDPEAPGGAVAISTRVRLARNLRGFPFPPAGNGESAAEVSQAVKEAIDRSGCLTEQKLSLNVGSLSLQDAEILFERRLVSRELLQNSFGDVHIAHNQSCSVMVNEEDHVRMQLIRPGLQLQQAWREIDRLDDCLCGELDIAYDGSWGFLTSCPSNVGTGVRFSVMLHLPALAMEDNIKQLERALAKLGLTIRGMFGEGSENIGNFYQISNQSTLGESEEEIMEQLGRVVDQVIAHEENTRSKLLEHHRNRLLDMIGRSFGTLRYSYILSGKEAYQALSGVRLGVDMKMFNALDINTINELLIAVSPGHLQRKAMRQLSEAERAVLRAQTVRERLKKSQSV